MERFTKSRERVLKVVNEAGGPLTAYDIARSCPDISLATVYRALDFLSRNREVKHFTVGEFTYYVANDVHEDFFVCTSCGRFVALDKCFANLYEDALRSSGMKPMDHLVLITGLCDVCSALSE